MIRFSMEKLVRDDVLQRCIDDPLVKTTYHTLAAGEYVEELIRKIHEEADEIPIQAEADAEVLSELADLQEAINALRDAYGVSPEDLEAAMDKKARKNGRFALRAYISYVDLDPSSEWVTYFRQYPDKYPESPTPTQ